MPNTSNGRPAIHAYMARSAHTAWHDFATTHAGTPLASVLEAIGEALQHLDGDDHLNLDDIVKRARTLAANNRRRDR